MDEEIEDFFGRKIRLTEDRKKHLEEDISKQIVYAQTNSKDWDDYRKDLINQVLTIETTLADNEKVISIYHSKNLTRG